MISFLLPSEKPDYMTNSLIIYYLAHNYESSGEFRHGGFSFYMAYQDSLGKFKLLNWVLY